MPPLFHVSINWFPTYSTCLEIMFLCLRCECPNLNRFCLKLFPRTFIPVLRCTLFMTLFFQLSLRSILIHLWCDASNLSIINSNSHGLAFATHWRVESISDSISKYAFSSIMLCVSKILFGLPKVSYAFSKLVVISLSREYHHKWLATQATLFSNFCYRLSLLLLQLLIIHTNKH